MQLLSFVITAVALTSPATANVAEMIIGGEQNFKGLCGNSYFENVTWAKSPSVDSCLDLAENVDMPVTYKITDGSSYTSIPTAGDCKFNILPWGGSSGKSWFIGGPDVADSKYLMGWFFVLASGRFWRVETSVSLRGPCYFP
jgi:Ecp2-like pathogen effector protein (putative necrosis-inducing factor)